MAAARLTGRAAAPGVAVAPAFVVARPHAHEDERAEPGRHRKGSPDEEVAALADALERAESELRELAVQVADTAGEEEAEIFEAHAEFAADPEILSRSKEQIDAGATAVEAITEAFGQFRALLAASASEYLAARAGDLDDVRDRVVKILRGQPTTVGVPTERSVVVADELTPSETATMPRDLMGAIVTASGSPTSHAAILSRALGIPAVVGVSGLLETVGDGGVELAVDGRTGEVIVAPDGDTRAAFERRAGDEQRRREQIAGLRDEPGRTADGTRVELAANIGDREGLKAAQDAGAEGSGLVRTEFLFLDRQVAPDLDEQIGFYRDVLTAFPGHRVVFRTLDVGADKPLPFVERPPEPNPALGVRGIRLSLISEELFRTQLRALLRARDGGGGKLAIMFPLVSLPEELVAARRILEEVAAEEGADTSDLEVGVMVEVPSAALAARRLAQHADFLSLGTNDLLQYLFAADRLVGDAAGLADLCDPDVLRLVDSVVRAAHAENAWVGVCGEAAAAPVTAAALVGLGAEELSMAASAVPEIKALLREVTLDDLRAAAQEAMAAGSADDAREAIEARLPAMR